MFYHMSDIKGSMQRRCEYTAVIVQDVCYHQESVDNTLTLQCHDQDYIQSCTEE